MTASIFGKDFWDRTPASLALMLERATAALCAPAWHVSFLIQVRTPWLKNFANKTASHRVTPSQICTPELFLNWTAFSPCSGQSNAHASTEDAIEPLRRKEVVRSPRTVAGPLQTRAGRCRHMGQLHRLFMRELP
jgi:hypothetical protein